MIIQHNIAALNSHRQLSINNSATAKNLEKLSSGFRINRAGDDAAGLAISEKMRGQIRGLSMAEQNTSHAINLIQTAEGGLQETHAILQRMRELAVQSSNGTYDNPNDRFNLEKEYQALQEEIDRIAESTHYNGIYLLNGGLSADQITTAYTTTSTIAAGATAAEFTGYTEPTAATDVVTTGSYINAGDSYEINILFKEDGSIDLENSTASFKDASGRVWDDVVFAFHDTTNQLTVTFTGSGVPHGGDDVVITLASVTSATKLNYTNAAAGDNAATLTIEGELDTPAAGVANSDASTYDNTLQYQVASQVRDDGEGLVFQIGANGSLDERVRMFIQNMDSTNLGVMTNEIITMISTDPDGNPVSKDYNFQRIVAGQSVSDTSIADQNDALDTAIAVLDAAINAVSSQRADLGAMQNRLEHTLNNLGVTKENLTAAESTIRDVDMAKEMMEYTKNSILVQASQAMLAQANMLPQGVLQLLG